jgi:hypothetical protein
MKPGKLSRAQKLILILMALAVLAVLALLVTLVQQGTPTSPLAPVASASLRPRATATIRPSPGATRSPATPVSASPIPEPSNIAPEVLAARRIEALVRDVKQVRELPQRLEIPINFLSDAETGGYLRSIMLDSQRHEVVQRQQFLMAALGLSPDPGQAFPPSVQTRVGHLIAFYDPDQEQIFVSTLGRDANPADLSLIHQYAHALVDQHFDLVDLAARAPNADAARARDALMEGDATAVLALHQYGGVEQADPSGGASGQSLDALAAHLAEVELTDYEGYLTSLAMEEIFLFPYREGTRFVAALLQTGWWPAVNAAYLDPPISTEQILHPEKYLNIPRDEPRPVFLPDLREDLEESWQLVAQSGVGELLLRAHLDQYLPDTTEAINAAAGWDGDLAAVWKDLDGREVWVMRTLWDDHDQAIEFVKSYTRVIDRRLRGARRVVRSIVPVGGQWYRGPEGDAYLQRTHDEVLVIWAPDTATMERVLAVFVLE